MVHGEVGIIFQQFLVDLPPTYEECSIILDQMDWDIIHSLHNDARKPLPEVASDVNASVQTVRRHVADMIKNGAIQLTIDWQPDHSNDIISFVHITLKPHVDRNTFSQRLSQKLSPHFFLFWTFSNLPNVIIGCGVDKHRCKNSK